MGVEGIEPSKPKQQVYNLPGLHSRLYTRIHMPDGTRTR